MNCLRNFIVLSTILVAAGCSTTYIEKPTPIAAIPAPPQIQPPQVQEIQRTAPGDPLSGSGLYNGPMTLDKNMTRDGASASAGGAASGTIMRFKDAYVQAKKPRIAIFLNRTLSDDVREWNTELRVAVSGDGAISKTRETLAGRTEETVKGNVAVAGQTALNPGATGGRISPKESYMWPFEDGFMQQFLRGGAVLVDRAAILRLTSRETSQKFDAIEAKKIEMNALLNYADIFIELLITRSPSAPSGYEFRATAKEVQTGRILANATSLNWDADQARPKKVITTSAGYEIVDDSSFPKVQVLSRDLALDLMNMLTAAWGGR